MLPGRGNDMNNVQPRLGFAYKLNDRTVLRGGSGVYFAEPLSVETYFMAQIVRLAVIQYTNDGRPDFAANPTNGQPLPTYEQALHAVLQREQRARLPPPHAARRSSAPMR